MTARRFGLIVNPIAGMGGAVGLRGTDGATTLARAVELGASPSAAERAKRALTHLAAAKAPAEIVTCSAPMGADSVQACGLRAEVIAAGGRGRSDTSAEDTRAAALEMKGLGVDLLVFAGGDGTARDVHGAVGES